MTVSAKNFMSTFAAAALIAVAVSACGGGNGPPPDTNGDNGDNGDNGGNGQPTSISVDLSRVTSGFMAEAGTVRISAGQMRDHGDIEFSCATGGDDCVVVVSVDSNGTVTATSTGGSVTAMNSDDYQSAITPMSVDLSGVAAGFMAGAGTVTVEAGETEDHGDIAFSCAAAGRDCEVTVAVDGSGTVTATSTGGTVTAMNSDAYSTQIREINEADSIHAATGREVVAANEMPVINLQHSYNSGSKYIGVTQSGATAGQIARAIPWVNAEGDVHFVGSLGSGLSASELDPLAWLGRSFNTSDISDDPDGIETTYREYTSDFVSSAWKIFEVTRSYSGNGTWTTNVATDAHNWRFRDAQIRPNEPGIGYGDFARNIQLSEIPVLPADRDWQGVDVAGGVKGSLDGVPGEFTCAQGVSQCWLELLRNADAEGYYPYKNVVFTRDDNLGSEALPDAITSRGVGRDDYLVFGTWLYVPDDVTAADDYDFGAFAGAGKPFIRSDTAAVEGEATYRGNALGMYFAGRTSDAPSVGSFVAQVVMRADFGDATDIGTLSGIVHDIIYDESTLGPLDLNLQGGLTTLEADIVSFPLSGAFPGFQGTEGMSAAGVTSGFDSLSNRWTGTWQAVFSEPLRFVQSHEPPTGVAGTFGASNGDHGLVGAFGARR